MHHAQSTTSRSDGDKLQAAGREQRSHHPGANGDLLISVFHIVIGRVHAWRERRRHSADVRAIYRQLAELDSRTLRDLGIHYRGELKFVAMRLARGEDL